MIASMINCPASHLIRSWRFSSLKNEILSERHLCFIVMNANSVLHRAQCNISILRIFNLKLPGPHGTLRYRDEKNRFCELWKKGEFILQMRSGFIVIEFLFVTSWQGRAGCNKWECWQKARWWCKVWWWWGGERWGSKPGSPGGTIMFQCRDGSSITRGHQR